MRVLTVLAFVCISAPLWAQPDPNVSSTYFPLEVGNTWEYEVTMDQNERPLAPVVHRDSLVSDTLVGGRRYIVQQRVRIDLADGLIYAEPLEDVLLRFDGDQATVVRRTATGEETPYLTRCALDLPVKAAPLDCGDNSVYEGGRESATVNIGPRNAPTDVIATTVKSFTRNDTDSLSLAAGIGIVRERRCDDDCRVRTLRYAKIGTKIYGETRVPTLIVVPDANIPQDYYPLALGHAWEYRGNRLFDPEFRIEIRRDTLIEGTRYFVREQWMLEPGTEEPSYSTSLIAADFMPRRASCLEAPLYLLEDRFGRTPAEAVCALQESGNTTGDLYFARQDLVLGKETTVKEFGNLGGSSSYAAGLGDLAFSGDPTGSGYTMRYARIDGEEFGTATLEHVTKPQPPEPWRFYPLAVGNAWEYNCTGSAFIAPMRREVVNDTLVNGERFFVIHQRAVEGYKFGSGSRNLLVRYDSTLAQVVTPGPGRTAVPISETPCSLRQPFGEGECMYESLRFLFEVVPTDAGPIIDGGTSSASIYYDSLAGSLVLAADFGLVSELGDASNVGNRLCYARINGVEHGTAELEHLTQVNVGDETLPAALSIAVYPNPTVEAAMLRIDSPSQQNARIAVFDVLGRRLWQYERRLPSGDTTLRLGSHMWPAGIYFAQVRTEDGCTETVQLTKR